MDFENPFAVECESFSRNFDEVLDSQDWNKTRALVSSAEQYATKHIAAQYTPLFYSIGTAYSDLNKYDPTCKADDFLEKALYYFRTALDLLNSHELEKSEYIPYIKGLRLPLLTNYANALSKCGRKIASIRFYRQVLQINPNFLMAKRNLGIELLTYARFVHDTGHKNFLYHFSYDCLKSVVNDSKESIHPDAKQHFSKILAEYNESDVKIFLEKPLSIPEYSMGNDAEHAYRAWCLNNHLFLNPLNDLPLAHSCFAADVLKMPDLITDIEQTDVPIFFGIFNQLKQEYIYARYLCYKGCSLRDKPHYADTQTHLVDLFDFPQYSIRIEELKTAFRLLYSIFDKVAFFLNAYWKLGIKERDISFHSIWKIQSGHGKRMYRHKNLHQAKDNSGIQSMWWMYKDFNDIFGNSPAPKRERLNILRNALEHKYVKVHDSLLYEVKEPYIDQELTYHISEYDLQNYTLDLMYMVRELIINLSSSVYIAEKNKRLQSTNKGFIPQVNLIDYDDAWKT